MTIIDRYILTIFVKVLFVCFCSFASLFVVIELFNNLDDFIALGKSQGSLVGVLQSYFAPRILSLFDRLSALLVLVAAIFALTWLQRTNELTAIMAGGIPLSRVMKPILVAAIAVSVFAIVNREILIPKFGKQLARNAQSWDGNAAKLIPKHDQLTGVLIGGQKLSSRESKIIAPRLELPISMNRLGARIEAKEAFRVAANPDHAAGYLLNNVSTPADLANHDSWTQGQDKIIFFPKDTPWLESNQIFISSNLDLEQLEFGDSIKQYASTRELIADAHNPSQHFGSSVRRTIHSRMLQPLLDLSLFVIGVPLVLSRSGRNFVVAAASALVLVAFYFGVTLLAASLGDSGLLTPYQSAWLPAFVMLPWAVFAYSQVDNK